tara:strand:+ start:2575 stop:3882 length:1308 start_codon:yes stop_codon:yes gene_type:complete
MLEIIFRFILFLIYGKNYTNLFFPYALISHKKFGYTLRPNLKIKNMKGFLFDKFFFLPNVNPINHTLKENLENRLFFSVNNLGFRGEALKKKSMKTIRIFCSGGSTTAGQSVSDNNTWPFHLEKELLKLGFNVEVINAGVFGWTSENEKIRIKEEIVKYNPDLILLHQGWNEEFSFSSLANGMNWKPNQIRSRLASSELFINNNYYNWLQYILTIYLFVKSFRRMYVLKKYLSFKNTTRWNVLQNDSYLHAWANNIFEILETGKKHNFHVIALDYPGLVSISDSPMNRKIYIENSRLDQLYAEYQAISKFRISNVLKKISNSVDVLDLNKCFISYKGKKRISLFNDEIHYSKKGNFIFAKNLALSLSKNTTFLKLTSNNYSHINNKLIGKTSDSKKLEISNPKFINRMINRMKIKISYSNIDIKSIIPSDRYTTF